MKKAISFAVAAVCCGLAWGTGSLPKPSIVSAQTGGAALHDWLTDGGDNERTGWNRNETRITKDNVKNLKLLWKLETGNQVRALHSLMPVLVVGQLNTPAGTKQVGFVNGISDNLYAFDVETGKIIWKKHWDYPAPAGRGGGSGGQAPQDPARLGFLQPGGSSDTPVIGPPDAQGRRPIYFVTGDGMLHTLDAATGEPLQPPFMFHTGKGWSLSLAGNVIWMANTYAGDTISAVRLDDPSHKVMNFNAGSGGAWGRRGATIDSTGTAWSTTGDGMCHIVNAADGEDLQPPFMFHTGKGWSLNLVGNVLWMANTYAQSSLAAVRLDDPQHKVMNFNAGSGGAWGRRGAAIDSTGTAWTTTGDGIYDPLSVPPRYANSVIGVHVVGDTLQLKDYYTPTNWQWLQKRDLDPNNTPTIFTYKGRELIAASGKECRVYLLDPKSAGGANHQTPLYKTPLFCNEEVDFQDAGSWGAMSTWEDTDGTR